MHDRTAVDPYADRAAYRARNLGQTFDKVGMATQLCNRKIVGPAVDIVPVGGQPRAQGLAELGDGRLRRHAAARALSLPECFVALRWFHRQS